MSGAAVLATESGSVGPLRVLSLVLVGIRSALAGLLRKVINHDTSLQAVLTQVEVVLETAMAREVLQVEPTSVAAVPAARALFGSKAAPQGALALTAKGVVVEVCLELLWWNEVLKVTAV